jgi:hypothetical protein
MVPRPHDDGDDVGANQRTVRAVAVALLAVTIGSAAAWLRQGVVRDREQRIEGFLADVEASAGYTAGYAAREGRAWTRQAAAALGLDPSPEQLQTYARASGFSSVTVFDADGDVLAAWGAATDRETHLAAFRAP